MLGLMGKAMEPGTGMYVDGRDIFILPLVASKDRLQRLGRHLDGFGSTVDRGRYFRHEDSQLEVLVVETLKK